MNNENVKVGEVSKVFSLPQLKDGKESSLKKLKERDHISFSQLHAMHTCAFKHYEAYELGKKDASTIFTIFGTATGVAIEQYIKNNNKQSWVTYIKTLLKFVRANIVPEEELKKKAFKDWCAKQNLSCDQKSYELYCKKVHCKSALRIYKDLIAYFNNELKDWNVVAFETPLMQPLDDLDINFKGYIDCVLKHKTEDRYKILDFKTCGMGWFKEQRSDTEKLYQVILYKKFWCELNKIERSKVDCAYLLLKRTPPKNESSIEMFDVTSGDKKINNAEVWMLKTLRNIFQGVKVKTPQTCNFCNCSLKNRRRYF